MNTLAIIQQPIDRLTLDPKNARLHKDRQIKQIAKSIESFHFNVPILVDRNNQVIAGHGRLLAAKKLGWTEVPTIQLAHLTAEQARAFAIADNRLTETSSWNEELLAESLKDLSVLNLDFSLEATGFTMAEIDIKIEGLSITEGKEPEESIVVGRVPVSKAGDLWQLDKHRLYCGDALDPASYTRLMQNSKAALVFTDPPYNVRIDGFCTGTGAIKHREFVMAAGEMSEQEFTEFLTKACKLLAAHSNDGSIHYICMDWRHVGELLAAGKTIYHALKNICVWVKDNGGMGSYYRGKHELVFVFKNGAAAHRNNVELGKHGRYRTNVWEYPSTSSFNRKSEEGNLLELHPTVKPVALIADAILDSSARNDIVLDPFLGSGSTLLAAERVGRICYGMELDPLYVDVAIRRWQKHTGQSAVHADSGRPFDELAAGAEALYVG